MALLLSLGPQMGVSWFGRYPVGKIFINWIPTRHVLQPLRFCPTRNSSYHVRWFLFIQKKDHKCVFERLNERHRSIQENHTVLVPLKFYRAFFIFLQTISKTQQRTKNYFGTLLEKWFSLHFVVIFKTYITE